MNPEAALQVITGLANIVIGSLGQVIEENKALKAELARRSAPPAASGPGNVMPMRPGE